MQGAKDEIGQLSVKPIGAIPKSAREGFDDGVIREFESGAIRDSAQGKYDYEGFLSPLALEAYAAYMHSHRKQADGSFRDSDNWMRGIDRGTYIKSLWRHLITAWKIHRGMACHDERDGHSIDSVEALCGVVFNAFGYMHEELKARGTQATLRESFISSWLDECTKEQR